MRLQGSSDHMSNANKVLSYEDIGSFAQFALSIFGDRCAFCAWNGSDPDIEQA